MEQGLKAARASGAAAAGMGGISGAGMSSPTSGAPGGMAAVSTPPLATVAPPDTGAKSIADEQGKRRPRKGGGAPSGSITHPHEEGEWGPLDQMTVSKDADGTWQVRNDESGESWRWDQEAEMWRGETEGTRDHRRDEQGTPEEVARRFSLS